jgi:hypothetical protein
MKTGTAHLPLHWGKAPRWLFGRMTKLAREITIAIIEEYGPYEMLVRLSDPYWFQAFGCVLGYDWHSSGVTTTVCGALKEGIKGIEKDLQFFIAGGKGKTSRKTPREIQTWSEKINLKKDPEELIYASKMCAKVDSVAIQDGYQLYHHNFFFTSKGEWAVIQQGMPTLRKQVFSPRQYNFDLRINPQQNYDLSRQFARRYHWLSEKVKNFVEEPQTAICDDTKLFHVLNLTDKKSQKAQTVITGIAQEKPQKIVKEYKKIITLSLPKREWIEYSDIKPKNLEKILLSTYINKPASFEQLLNIKGIGPRTIRALTLISELTYGTKASWEDPVKYSFAHGGKDGYPYPVDRQTYDESINFLKNALQKSKIERSEKKKSLMKLTKFF